MSIFSGISIYDFLSLIAAFVIYGNGGIICINGLIVEEFLEDYQAGETLTTWVASVQIGLCQSTGFIAGALVELYGNRVVPAVGTVLATLGFVLTAVAQNVGTLFFTYSILTGVGLGLQYVPALIVPQFVFTKRRELAMAFIVTGCSTGAFVFPVMFNYFREEYGYRGALLLWAGIMLNCIPLAMLMTMHPQLPRNSTSVEVIDKDERSPPTEVRRKYVNIDITEEKEIHGKTGSTQTKHGVDFENAKALDSKNGYKVNGLDKSDASPFQPASTGESERMDSTLRLSRQSQYSLDDSTEKDIEKLPLPGRTLKGELRRMVREMQQGILELRGGSCRVLMAVVFLFCSGYMMPYIFLPGKALQLGLSKAQAAWLVAAIGMSETIWRLIAGVVAFMFKDHIVIFYGVAIVVCGGACIGMLFVTSFNGFLVAAVIYGAGLGSYVCIYTLAAIAIIGISKIVRMIGLIALAWGLAYLISPSLGASVYQATGNVNVPFYLGSSLQLLAAVVLFCYRVSPIYHTRPGALEATTQQDFEDASPGSPPCDAILASSHRSLASLASTPTLGSHFGVIWRGSGSWVGSTHSRVYSNVSTPLNRSATDLS